jgi:xanthine dehydrogenase accessory factor
MDINRLVVELAEAGRSFAVGLVLSAEGSTPREAGVKAVIEADGRIHGTLGGGAVEAEAQRRAVEACRSGRPIVFEVRLAGEAAADREPLCGGEMKLLVDPTAAMDVDAYRQAAEAVSRRERGVLLTVIHLGGDIATEVQWRPQPDLADDEATLRTEGEVLTLSEPIIPRPLLVIAGGGHVGRALAVQGDLLGFGLLVLDDRPEFADPALFPVGAETRCGDFAIELAAAPLGPETYVVIVTRGHQHDAEALRACIHRPLAYLGMIGSRRKVALLRQSFLDAGWATEAELDRVHAPVGLDLGAETVPEIAVSIAAELVAIRRRGESPGSMRKAADR